MSIAADPISPETSISTLPTAPFSTASWAAAVSSSGKWCRGTPASSPTRSAPASTAARHVLDRGLEVLVGEGVEDQELEADVLPERRPQRHRQLVAAVVRVDRDQPVHPDDLEVDPDVLRRRDLDRDVHAVRREREDLLRRVGLAVVHDVVGAGGPGQRGLLLAAHGRDDRGARPRGRAGSRRCRRRPLPRRPARPCRPARPGPSRCRWLAGGERPVRGHGRDAEAGAEVEVRVVGQRDHPRRRAGRCTRRPCRGPGRAGRAPARPGRRRPARRRPGRPRRPRRSRPDRASPRRTRTSSRPGTSSRSGSPRPGPPGPGPRRAPARGGRARRPSARTTGRSRCRRLRACARRYPA